MKQNRYCTQGQSTGDDQNLHFSRVKPTMSLVPTSAPDCTWIHKLNLLSTHIAQNQCQSYLFVEWRSSDKESLALICPVRLNMKRRSKLLVPIDLSSGNLRRMFPKRLGSLGWKLLLYSNSDAWTLSCSFSMSCWS